MINKNKPKYFGLLFLGLLIVPQLTYGQSFDLAGSSFKGIIEYIVELLNLLIPSLFLIAFIVFFWGLSKFILNGSGNAAELKKGKSYMMWGILALFILVSYKAIVSIVSSELEIKNQNNTSQDWIPKLPE